MGVGVGVKNLNLSNLWFYAGLYTSRHFTCYCTIYPSFVSIPIYYSAPIGSVLLNYWSIYSFDEKQTVLPIPNMALNQIRLIQQTPAKFLHTYVLLLLHTRVLIDKYITIEREFPLQLLNCKCPVAHIIVNFSHWPLPNYANIMLCK